MTTEEIQKLVSRYIENTLADMEEAQVEGIGVPHDPDEHDEMLNTRELLLAEARENIAMNQHDRVKHIADNILAEPGLALNRDTTA